MNFVLLCESWQATAAIESIANGTNPNGLLDFQKFVLYFISFFWLCQAWTLYDAEGILLSKSARWSVWSGLTWQIFRCMSLNISRYYSGLISDVSFVSIKHFFSANYFEGFRAFASRVKFFVSAALSYGKPYRYWCSCKRCYQKADQVASLQHDKFWCYNVVCSFYLKMIWCLVIVLDSDNVSAINDFAWICQLRSMNPASYTW